MSFDPRTLSTIDGYTVGALARLFRTALDARELPVDELTSQQAAALLVVRDLARSHLEGFVRYVAPDDYAFTAAHLEALRYLEALITRNLRRLAVSAPPRFGKSMLVGYAAAWALGRDANEQVVFASYSTVLASNFVRSVRALLEGDRFGEVFDTRTDQTSRAQDLVRIAGARGYVFAASTSSTLTGWGATFLALDDLTASLMDARSPAKQREVETFYTGTALTRLAPTRDGFNDSRGGGVVAAIGTRWTVSDILSIIERDTRGRADAKVLKFPALDERDESSIPERMSTEMLHERRRELGARVFAALYQANPLPSEATLFRSEFFDHRYEPDALPHPDLLTRVTAIDLALGDGRGDYTVIGNFGIDNAGKLYVVDVWRERKGVDAAVDQLMRMLRAWRSSVLLYETDPMMSALRGVLMRRFRDARLSTWTIPLPAAGANKVDKASALAAMAERGDFLLPRSAPWLEPVLSELCLFPDAAHDDITDVMGMPPRAWAKLTHGKAAPVPASAKPRAQPFVVRADDGGNRTSASLDELHRSCGPWSGPRFDRL